LLPYLNDKVFFTGMQSVLDRMYDGHGNNKGKVAHEESIGGQALFLKMKEFNDLAGQNKWGDAANLLRDVLNERVIEPRHDYTMVDDDFLLVMLEKLFFNAQDGHGKDDIRDFLGHKDKNGATNLEKILWGWNFVLGKIDSLVTKQGARQGLVRITGEKTGQWRDVGYGLADGTYPGDVNAVLAPLSIEGIKTGIAALEEIFGLGLEEFRPEGYKVLQDIIQKDELGSLKKYLDSSREFEKASRVWALTAKKFDVHLGKDELLEILSASIDAESNPIEKEGLWNREIIIENGIRYTVRDILAGRIPSILKQGVNFLDLAHDDDGRGTGVMSSDGIFGLFYNDQMSPVDFLKTLQPLMLRYPLGLFAPEAGVLAANPLLQSNPWVRDSLNRNAYGATVVYGFQMKLLQQALQNQIKRCFLNGQIRPEVPTEYVQVLYSALEVLEGSFNKIGGLKDSECWKIKIQKDGSFTVVPFGEDKADNEESNIEQLWSFSFTSADTDKIHDMVEKQGIHALAYDQMITTMWELQQELYRKQRDATLKKLLQEVESWSRNITLQEARMLYRGNDAINPFYYDGGRQAKGVYAIDGYRKTFTENPEGLKWHVINNDYLNYLAGLLEKVTAGRATGIIETIDSLKLLDGSYEEKKYVSDRVIDIVEKELLKKTLDGLSQAVESWSVNVTPQEAEELYKGNDAVDPFKYYDGGIQAKGVWAIDGFKKTFAGEKNPKQFKGHITNNDYLNYLAYLFGKISAGKAAGIIERINDLEVMGGSYEEKEYVSDQTIGIVETRLKSIISGVDNAQLTNGIPLVKSSTPGGIDLDPMMLNFQVKRDGKGMAFPVAADGATRVNGFTPVIIRITSMSSPLLSD
jgi:hypothetical protein